MQKALFILLLILLVPALWSCGSSEPTGYHGYLYFARGSYLLRFSLRDASLSVVTNLGDKSIRHISYFGENKLLITELASINRKTVSRISWVDVKTGQSEALYSGVSALYLAHTDVIVYDDGGKLFAVSLTGGSDSDEIFSHRRNKLSTMIELADGIVLFETDDAGQRSIHSYDTRTGELQSLDRLSGVCRLGGAVWINDLEQLACRERTSQGNDSVYVLASLEGNVPGRLALPAGKRFLALAYVSKQGALILSERWRSKLTGQEKSAVWVYDIHSGETRRLAKNQNLGASVVYTDF